MTWSDYMREHGREEYGLEPDWKGMAAKLAQAGHMAMAVLTLGDFASDERATDALDALEQALLEYHKAQP